MRKVHPLSSPECQNLRDLVAAYADECLDARERALVERHLGQCVNCRAELERLQGMYEQLRQVSARPAPLTAAEEHARWRTVEQQMRGISGPEGEPQDEPQPTTVRRRPRWFAWQLAAAAVCLGGLACCIHVWAPPRTPMVGLVPCQP